MARPKKPTDELKDQRVPIVMSADELKFLDDWRFQNRIASRGDAIRRLCRMAIVADDDWGVIMQRILDVKFRGLLLIDKIAESEQKAPWISTLRADLLDLQMDAIEQNAQLRQLKAGYTASNAIAGARLAKEQLRAEYLDEKALYALNDPYDTEED